MRYPAIFLVAMAISACGQSPAPPPAESQEPAAQIEPASSAPASGYSPLPAGVALTSPFHIRNDRIYQNDRGETRRRVAIELLDVEIAQAPNLLTDAMEDAGYTSTGRREGKNGRFSLRFKKAGEPNIAVDFLPDLEREPNNPDAKSLIVIAWELRPAPQA